MEFNLLPPIDFTAKDAASDPRATNVRILENAAYSDSPRGTMSFFGFYHPIVRDYVEEFDQTNGNALRDWEKADLFWLVMRNAFALLPTYEHKGYGSFRNLLRTLVNYNAVRARGDRWYAPQQSEAEREMEVERFLETLVQMHTLQIRPEFRSEKLVTFLFDSYRLDSNPGTLAKKLGFALDADSGKFLSIGREIDAFQNAADNVRSRVYEACALSDGDVSEQAFAAIAGYLARLRPENAAFYADLVRNGRFVGAADASALFGRVFKGHPEWFSEPASFFEGFSAGDLGAAQAAEPEG